MPQCWKCKRQGLFLALGSKSKLCIDCLDIACDAATQTLKELSKGESARTEMLHQINIIKAATVAEEAIADTGGGSFSEWDVSVHSSPDQLNRIRRSTSVKIISYDPKQQTAVVAGSGSSTYTTTFSKCSCGDFISRHLPCKHMYRLAAKYGGVDFSKFL